MFLGAGLVLSGCGDDDTATTPAPAPPPPPPPPAPEPEPEPEAPATPTGLMVSATTIDSITWTWDAVEGAIGYAVQVSADEMFDATDTIHPAAETTFTASPLPPETSVYVRVAAAGGTLEAPILSGWTTHVTGMSAMPPPPPPAPDAPATPTGLMSETGEGSITWSWDAVEGADGYAVQVSMDEMFDDMDDTTYTMETSHSVGDLGYSETRFARVASTSGMGDAMLMSMWTTHLTGMSAAEPPPPPPPAPDPVEVTFSLSDDADSPHFVVADDDDDEATAMASVNTEIMVESNASAVVTPMFVDDANAVSVSAGSGNTPFTYVDWEMLQSDVLDGGATFMVQRTTVGANQEMEPTGDVAYVTCGPFECQDGADAPEISIANSGVCNAWNPTVDIQVGKVDNDVIFEGTDDTGNDGVDLGIVTSSNTAMKIKHVWSGVANGRNTSTTTDAAKGSNKALTVNWVADIVQVDAGPDNDADETADNIDACDNTYDTGELTDEPENCFRLLGPGPAKGAPDYLAGYSLELSPEGAGVTWGRVDWGDDDPFEDLKCDSMTMVVMDQVDICAMFEDEVDYAVGGSDDWTPSVVFDSDSRLVRWTATAKNSGTDDAATDGKAFKTLWFDDNLNGKIEDDGSADRSEAVTGVADANAMHDLYNQNVDTGNIEAIWESLTDEDGDPNAGDLGKVDMVHDADDDDTDVDETSTNDNAVHPDGKADNYPAGALFDDVRKCTEADGGDDDDGSICDATWTRDAEVTFADRTFGCSTTRMVSIKCTWDADGGMADGRNALPQAFDPDNNPGNFLKCEAE